MRASSAIALARAHARAGDSVAIAAYLGKSDTFARSVTEFADAYADQNARDFAAFTDAVTSGGMPVVGEDLEISIKVDPQGGVAIHTTKGL